MVRDAYDTITGAAGTLVIEPVQKYQAIGLDFFIHNTGANNVTVSVDGQNVITVSPGGVYTFNDVKYGKVKIIATAGYEAQWFGVKTETLTRRGLI